MAVVLHVVVHNFCSNMILLEKIMLFEISLRENFLENEGSLCIAL